jgi:hypothetical protein
VAHNTKSKAAVAAPSRQNSVQKTYEKPGETEATEKEIPQSKTELDTLTSERRNCQIEEKKK